MICHFRSGKGITMEYEKNTSDIILEATVTGLIKELTLLNYPHRVDLQNRKVYHLETNDVYDLIYGYISDNYPNGCRPLTVQELTSYALGC